MYFSVDYLRDELVPGMDEYVLEFKNYEDESCSEIPKETQEKWDELIRSDRQNRLNMI